MDKRKFKRICGRVLTADGIKLILLFVPLTLLFISEIKTEGFSLERYLDTGILVSFFLVFVCNSLAYVLGNAVGKYCEDPVKLTTEYGKLCARYSRAKLLEFRGEVFPVVELAFRRADEPPFRLEINGERCGEVYAPPKRIADNYGDIFRAHSHSDVYNSRAVRLDGLRAQGGKLLLTYSRTAYYDSLVTNRAMDYPWSNGMTTREIYEPGPFVSELEDSQLSNHLGFNGFVETADGKIIFVMRSDRLTIGKHTLADSVGASLKAKYCLDERQRLTAEGLDNAVRREIYDELKIRLDDGVEALAGVFAFYRDLVEGGKPQFLFYIKLSGTTAADFAGNFRSAHRLDAEKTTVDGVKFVFLSADELSRSTVAAGQLRTPDGRSFRMMPSASASIALLLRYLGK